jgi:segregation and condensation protein A
MRHVRVEKFEGPLELLLDLIERERLDITEISLSQVTEQYLSYLNQLVDRNPDELADFLVVASKLLLIKSRILIPDLVVDDDDGTDLAMQLKMYKEYYEASKVIHAMLLKKHFSFSRSKPAVAITPMFQPPHGLNADSLKQLFLGVLHEIEPIVELPREVLRRAVSLQEKISNIRNMILTEANIRFSSLMHNAESKMEVIVTFLALLELVKQKTIIVTQSAMFEDIVVESLENKENV